MMSNMMKVKVSVTYRAANMKATEYEIGVTRDDLVADVKDKMAAVARIAFAMTLMFEGKPMESAHYLADYDVEENDSLELVIDANEQTVLAQLEDIIGSRTLRMDELSMFYIYRFGMPVNDALKSVGFGANLESFLVKTCGFVVDKNKVRRGEGPLLADIKPAAIWQEAADDLDREDEEWKAHNAVQMKPVRRPAPRLKASKLLADIDSAAIWAEAHEDIDSEEEDRRSSRSSSPSPMGPAAKGLTKFWHPVEDLHDPWACTGTNAFVNLMRPVQCA